MKYLIGLAIVLGASGHLKTQAATLCPDGTYVSGTTCRLAPNGKYVSGDSPMRLAPNGTYTSGTPRLTPKGTFIGEPEQPGDRRGRTPLAQVQRMCPDGTYVYGFCRLQPNGKYVGE
jgi:hypothetical protein